MTVLVPLISVISKMGGPQCHDTDWIPPTGGQPWLADILRL